jgi:hypothetical protein
VIYYSGCKADAEAHSTAHVRNTSADKHAEVGWHEYWNGNSHLWNLFWEVRIGSALIGDLGDAQGISCCPVIRFKVEYHSDTDNWHFYWDRNADGGFNRVGASGGEYAHFSHGIPMGETARKGNTATGASDHQWNLRFIGCVGCSQSAWTSSSTYSNTITNWHVEYPPNSETEYTVAKD